jgi:hypothetical protein
VGEGGLEPPHPFGHRNLNSVLTLLSDITVGVIVPLSRDNAQPTVQTVTSGATGFLTVREHPVSISGLIGALADDHDEWRKVMAPLVTPRERRQSQTSAPHLVTL